MNRSDLSEYRQMRFRKANTCPLCRGRIFDDDEIIMERKKTGKTVKYIFFHERCVKDAKQKDEEAQGKYAEKGSLTSAMEKSKGGTIAPGNSC